MSGDLAVQVSGLEKSFGKVSVLAGVDLNVSRGSVFSLLGPNGVGKTTTVRILATLTRADAGTAKVAGYDIARDRRKVRRSISLAGQYAAVDDLQTGAENLRMMARLSGLPGARARRRADELLEQFWLSDAGGRKAGTYSGGMRRRLDLAASLVGSPSVIFLDEPSTGLDLRSRQLMWQVVASRPRGRDRRRARGRRGHAGPAEAAGRRAAPGPAGGRHRRIRQHRPGRPRPRDRQRRGQPDHRDRDGTAGQVRALLDELDPLGSAVRRFSVHTATLNDVFLALTGCATSRPEKETSSV